MTAAAEGAGGACGADKQGPLLVAVRLLCLLGVRRWLAGWAASEAAEATVSELAAQGFTAPAVSLVCCCLVQAWCRTALGATC